MTQESERQLGDRDRKRESRSAAIARGWKIGQEVWQPKNGRINWGKPNVWIIATLAAGLLVTSWPQQATYFGLISGARMASIIGYVFGLLTIGIARAFIQAIESFEPKTQIEAKRANEQIKATATLINAAAAGLLTVFVLARVANSERPNYFYVVVALGFALYLLSKSRVVLGLLKDESLPAAVVVDQA